MAESLNLQELEEELESEDTISQHEYIASYAYSTAYIAVAYYNTSTLELSLGREAVDLKPDFWHLKNLFRQLNQKKVLASGPTIFLRTVMQLMGLPDEDSPTYYSVSRLKSTSTSQFLVYANNDKTLMASRKRIYELRLSHMAGLITAGERHSFIETLIPMEQNLLVQALGSLLSYLEDNWNHMFLRTDRHPVISNILTYHLDTQMLMDDASLCALQIFNVKDHPSAFKRSASGSKREAMSLYYMINKSASRIGSMELKMVLQQPIRDIEELRTRHATIEWCMSMDNANMKTRMCTSLRSISALSELYQKMMNNRSNANIWKNFKRGLYYGLNAGTICQEAMQLDAVSVAGTIIEALGKFTAETKTMHEVMEAINMIVDMEESFFNNRFCVKCGLDAALDAKKDKFREVIDILKVAAETELQALPECITQLSVHFIQEVGFLVSISMTDVEALENISSISSFQYVYRSNNTAFYRNELCTELNGSYANLHAEISCIENKICDSLLEHIGNKLFDIQHMCKLCARLDALMSLASFSLAHHLRKPQLVEHGKTLEIRNGRHLLMERSVANNTLFSVQAKNLIHVLIAPNASGKSVYLKQVAQIVYLAHIGCFVPAEAARMTLMDAVYTRIYSPETIHMAKSSFLIELQQMSHLMMTSSTNSLILIDEFGQGTIERDGRALVQSCLEHLNERAELAPITILSTHYTAIYSVLAHLEWISFKTFNVVRDADGALLSTFELIDGCGPDSYASDCREVRDFIHHAMEAKISEQHVLLGPNDNQDHGIIDNAEVVYRTKIRCAAECVRAFVHNQQTDNSGQRIDIVNLFENFRIN